VGIELLGRPAARAALPGLIAEMTSDPTLHADVIGRFAGGSWGWLQQRIEGSIERSSKTCGVASRPSVDRAADFGPDVAELVGQRAGRPALLGQPLVRAHYSTKVPTIASISARTAGSSTDRDRFP